MSNSLKPSTLFWVAGGAFVLWNLFGCGMFYLDQTMSDAAYTESYSQAMTDLRDQYPLWATIAYAVAVFGGLVASVLFLLRKRAATTLFIVSLVAAIISFIWGFITPEYKAAAGSAFWVMPVIVTALGAFEVWYSRKQVAAGLLS